MQTPTKTSSHPENIVPKTLQRVVVICVLAFKPPLIHSENMVACSRLHAFSEEDEAWHARRAAKKARLHRCAVAAQRKRPRAAMGCALASVRSQMASLLRRPGSEPCPRWVCAARGPPDRSLRSDEGSRGAGEVRFYPPIVPTPSSDNALGRPGSGGAGTSRTPRRGHAAAHPSGRGASRPHDAGTRPSGSL